MLTTKQSLERLLKERGPGWDRVAEAMIARVFYGGCEGMVRHHLALIDNLATEGARLDRMLDSMRLQRIMNQEHEQKAAAA